MNIFNKLIDRLSSNPRIFILLRKILEANFKTLKEVIYESFLKSEDGLILDIGCGTGEFSSCFMPENYIGIDIEEKYIDFAKKNNKGKFLLADALALPFSDELFSKIIIVGVLHHLNDGKTEKVLKEAARVLKGKGKILIIEDVDFKSNNFLTNLIHYLDKGKNIRTAEGYAKLINSFFKIIKTLRITSGLGAYQVFLLEKKDEQL